MNQKEVNLDAINAFHGSLQELSRRFNDQLSPLMGQLEGMQHSLQSALKHEEIDRAVASVFKNVQRNTETLGLALADFSQFGEGLLGFQKAIQTSLFPAFEQLRRSFNDFPPRMQQALILLGDHGWYMDLDMPFPSLWEIAGMLAEGDVPKGEKALVDYFTDRVDEIERSIIQRFHHRKTPVSAAFNAHRRNEYVLSIPVLLAQTDGICKELANHYLFMKYHGKSQIVRLIEQVSSDTLRAVILSPLAESLPISASEHERTPSWNELNRHMVLHGESSDYGNEINGLKAISLINYVSEALSFENDNPHEKTSDLA